MSEKGNNKDEGHRQARKQTEFEVTTTAFLGGIAFAAMVFVMQAQEDFVIQGFSYYPEILITTLAGICFILIIANILNTGVASGADLLGSTSANLASSLSSTGVMAFVIIIPFMLLPFTLIGTIVLIIIETVVVVRIIRYYQKILSS